MNRLWTPRNVRLFAGGRKGETNQALMEVIRSRAIHPERLERLRLVLAEVSGAETVHFADEHAGGAVAFMGIEPALPDQRLGP